MIVLWIVLSALSLTLGAPALLVKTASKGKEKRYFEFVWRFSKWAKRPVYRVEYFGLPWEYTSHKEGHFRQMPTWAPRYERCSEAYRQVHGEKMQWRLATYPDVKDGHWIRDVGPIECHSERKARWEFKHFAMFKQNPYLEFRVVLKEPGILKSAKRQAVRDADETVRHNYRAAYIASLEEEVERLRSLEG
jgi:hypothetical protein